MNAADARIPVTLLTGFLGSGKTTVLNRLLREPGMDGTVVIVNEFGEIGLDHLLIETSEERFALLDNGCVCCSVRGDLVDTLKELYRRGDTAGIPAVGRVVIETTGLADPAPILHTLMAEPELAARYRIGAVVTTVDAVNGLATLGRHAEAAKQVAVADRLLITKTDLATIDAGVRLERRLSELSPAATIAVAEHGAVDMDLLLDAGITGGHDAADLVASLGRAQARLERAHAAACGPECRHDHHHDHRHAHHGIQSHSFIIDRPVDWPSFSQWLDYVAMLKGDDMLRLKGIVQVADDPDRPLVVHGVQHVLHPPTRLGRWPSADRRTRLVFIVRGIPRDIIERTLVKFAAVEAAGTAKSPVLSAA